MASGSPSSRTQISATAGAFALSTAKPGLTATARSTNRATDSNWVNCSRSGRWRGSGRPSGGDQVLVLAVDPERAAAGRQDRQARGETPAGRRSAAPHRRPARRCRRRAGRRDRQSARPADPRSRLPGPAARPPGPPSGTSRSGLVIGSRATKYTPPAYRSAASAATWRASRVLPVPPGPVRVTSRLLASSSRTSATSRWRPRNEVSWSGRLFGVASRVRGGGNSVGETVDRELPKVLRSRQVLEPMLAEVGEAHAGRRARAGQGLGRGRDAAPGRHARLRRRGPRGGRRGRRSCRHRGGPRRCGGPSGPGPRRRAARPRRRAPAGPAAAAATARGAEGKTAKKASPSVLISVPSPAAIASRSRAWWRSRRSVYASPSDSSSRVLPSMSVNRKVTVPVGQGRHRRPLVSGFGSAPARQNGYRTDR